MAAVVHRANSVAAESQAEAAVVVLAATVALNKDKAEAKAVAKTAASRELLTKYFQEHEIFGRLP